MTVRLHSNKLIADHGLKEKRTNHYYGKYTTLVYNNEWVSSKKQYIAIAGVA